MFIDPPGRTHFSSVGAACRSYGLNEVNKELGTARPLRVEFIGAWFHVMACGNERRPIFRSDMDRGHWLQLVGDRG